MPDCTSEGVATWPHFCLMFYIRFAQKCKVDQLWPVLKKEKKKRKKEKTLAVEENGGPEKNGHLNLTYMIIYKRVMLWLKYGFF